MAQIMTNLSAIYFKSQDGSIKTYADVDPNPWPSFSPGKVGASKITIPTADSSGNPVAGVEVKYDFGSDPSTWEIVMNFEYLSYQTVNTLVQLIQLRQPILVSPDNGQTQEYLMAFTPQGLKGIMQRGRIKGLMDYSGEITFIRLSQTIGTNGMFDKTVNNGIPVTFSSQSS